MLDKVLALGEKELEKFHINPKDFLNQQQDKSKSETKEVNNEKSEEMKPTTEQKADEQKNEFKQFDTNRIPESEYQKYGINPENLEGELKAMSYGYKSPHLVDINPNIEGVDYPMKAQQQQVDLDKPFQNTINSLTDQAIRKGLENLMPGKEYDNLYASAKARSQADWVVGINASQALSISAGRGVWSLGRVQTPTLAMICSRYLENKDFKPQTYFQVKLHGKGCNSVCRHLHRTLRQETVRRHNLRAYPLVRISQRRKRRNKTRESGATFT